MAVPCAALFLFVYFVFLKASGPIFTLVAIVLVTFLTFYQTHKRLLTENVHEYKEKIVTPQVGRVIC